MTSEKRTLVGFEDIKAISLECRKCKVRFSYGPEQKLRVPKTCPNPDCNSSWSPEITRGIEIDKPVSVRFVDMLVGLMAEQTKSGSDGFRILLEFDETN